MGYNMQNILVNFNEQIKKGGGGGSIPALQLAVSQLQVSMASVKSSVASVSAEVDRIKADLAAVESYRSTPSKIGTTGTADIERVVIAFDDAVSIPSNDWTDTVFDGSDMDCIISAVAIGADTCCPVLAGTDGTLQAARSTGLFSALKVVIEYIKKNETRKKGGKK